MAKHKNVKRFASDVASSAGSEITASAPITTSADKRCLSRWKSVPSKRILLPAESAQPPLTTPVQLIGSRFRGGSATPGGDGTICIK